MNESKKFNFKSIPKFTGTGSYRVNVSLTDIKWYLDRHIDKHNLQLDPDFQRGHVWTEKQQIKYIEYLLAGGYSGRSIFINCVGWMNDFKGPMVLVDGLQRITAALRFTNNEIKAYSHFYKDYDRIPDLVDFEIYINNLKTRREVLTWYVQLNEGGVIHTAEEIARVKNLIKEEESAI